MKKTISFFMVIVFPALCFCQLWNLSVDETANKKIRFGVNIGLAFSNVHIEYNETYNHGYEKPGSKTGFIGGFYSNMDLNKKLSFQPAILLVNKGMNENHQYGGSYRTNLSYLEIPLNLLYKSTSAKGSFFIGGGPAPSFYTGGTLYFSGDNDLKKIDFGINFLTGYEIPIGFSVNLNYTHGLPNISGNKEFLNVIKNRSFGFAIGYTF